MTSSTNTDRVHIERRLVEIRNSAASRTAVPQLIAALERALELLDEWMPHGYLANQARRDIARILEDEDD